MKKVININFQGRVIPIEESAYDILKKYIESLTKYFAQEDGRDEIINDIEGRIGELFAETLKKGNSCISDDDIERIIESMGRPEDFEADELNVQSQLSGNESYNKQTNNTYTESTYAEQTAPKKLYRDENNKILGGVCSGLGNYFGIDPLVVRIISLVLLFSFGIGFIPYIIIWVAVPSSATKVIGSRRKRLFRDADDKIVAGVASGLGHYFGINAWIPRVLFLIPFISFIFKWGHWGFFDYPGFLKFSFSPGTLIAYIILWLILPEAKSSADKLEMKGEKVDFNSIKETIQGDLKSFSKKAENWGNEITEKSKEWGENLTQKTQEFSKQAQENFKETGEKMASSSKIYTEQFGKNVSRSSRGLGDIIALLFKIFAYFIIGCFILSTVIGLFAFGTLATGLLPLKSYVLRAGWQNTMAWGTLILFIWVPIIGVITFIIRRITKSKANSNPIRWGFTALWIIGWFCLMSLISSVYKDFKYQNSIVEENIVLANPLVNKLDIKTNPLNAYYNNSILNIESFASVDDDTAYVRNIWVRIVRSNNDSFQVKITKRSQGHNKAEANELANKINFDVTQQDSVLMLSKGVNVNTTDKFRNQHVIITIAVPVGKRFIVSNKANFGRYNSDRIHLGPNNYWDYDNYEDGSFNYDSDKEYIMTATRGVVPTKSKYGKEKYSYDSDDENYDDSEETFENFKRDKQQLQEEIEEKKRRIEQEQRDLEEKERELNKSVDTSTPRYKYKAAIVKPDVPKKAMAKEKIDNKLDGCDGFLYEKRVLTRLVS